MLTRIDLNNFILLKKSFLDIKDNFTAITGESGSGKSMILEAIRFCLGLSKHKDLSATGETSVSLEFDLTHLPEARTMLEDSSIQFEENTVILRRIIAPDQKSKCFINDILVSINFLKTLSNHLLEIHGQEDRSFDDSAKLALTLIDQFANHSELPELAELYKQYNQCLNQVESLKEEIAKTTMEKGFYDFAIKEITELKLKDNEVAELEVLKNTANNFAQISDNTSALMQLLKGRENIIGNCWAAHNKCEKLSTLTANHKLAQSTSILEKIAIELEECVATIEQETSNPRQELSADKINDRLYLIKSISRKYRVTPEELGKVAEDYQTKLNLLENSEEKLSKLEEHKKQLWDKYLAIARQISQRRMAVASELASTINSQLSDLKMEGAMIAFYFNNPSDPKPTALGIDQIEIMAKTNQKLSLQKIKDIASGGEKSRVMLVIKSISKPGSAKTIIFDEIDSGIGGSTATAVGRKIKSLSHNQQILLITHNAQVAAMCTQLFKVEKRYDIEGTKVTISEMQADHKQEEIARMISGDLITAEALAQAKHLITAS